MEWYQQALRGVWVKHSRGKQAFFEHSRLREGDTKPGFGADGGLVAAMTAPPSVSATSFVSLSLSYSSTNFCNMFLLAALRLIGRTYITMTVD